MNPNDTHDADARLLALAGREGRVRLMARNVVFDGRGGSSLDPAAAEPGPLDLLLGALATDLVAGFGRHAHRAGMAVYDCELRLEARLENPLVALGVVGERGSPAVREIKGTFYVSCGPGTEPLETLWGYTLAQSAVFATLVRNTVIDITLAPQA